MKDDEPRFCCIWVPIARKRYTQRVREEIKLAPTKPTFNKLPSIKTASIKVVSFHFYLSILRHLLLLLLLIVTKLQILCCIYKNIQILINLITLNLNNPTYKKYNVRLLFIQSFSALPLCHFEKSPRSSDKATINSCLNSFFWEHLPRLLRHTAVYHQPSFHIMNIAL